MIIPWEHLYYWAESLVQPTELTIVLLPEATEVTAGGFLSSIMFQERCLTACIPSEAVNRVIMWINGQAIYKTEKKKHWELLVDGDRLIYVWNKWVEMGSCQTINNMSNSQTSLIWGYLKLEVVSVNYKIDLLQTRKKIPRLAERFEITNTNNNNNNEHALT